MPSTGAYNILLSTYVCGSSIIGVNSLEYIYVYIYISLSPWSVRNVRWEATWILSLRRSSNNERCPARTQHFPHSHSQLMIGGMERQRACAIAARAVRRVGERDGGKRKGEIPRISSSPTVPPRPWLKYEYLAFVRQLLGDRWLRKKRLTVLSYLQALTKAAFYTSAYKGCFWGERSATHPSN